MPQPRHPKRPTTTPKHPEPGGATNDKGARKRPPFRRESILSAAAQLFREKGFVETTLEEIAQPVGIVTSALYRHFPSKAHMLAEIFSRAQDQLEASLEAAYSAKLSPLETVRTVIRAALKQHREFGDIVSQLRQGLSAFPQETLHPLLQRQARIDYQWERMIRDVRPDLSRAQTTALVRAIGGVMESSEAKPTGEAQDLGDFYEKLLMALILAPL